MFELVDRAACGLLGVGMLVVVFAEVVVVGVGGEHVPDGDEDFAFGGDEGATEAAA